MISINTGFVWLIMPALLTDDVNKSSPHASPALQPRSNYFAFKWFGDLVDSCLGDAAIAPMPPPTLAGAVSQSRWKGRGASIDGSGGDGDGMCDGLTAIAGIFSSPRSSDSYSGSPSTSTSAHSGQEEAISISILFGRWSGSTSVSANPNQLKGILALLATHNSSNSIASFSSVVTVVTVRLQGLAKSANATYTVEHVPASNREAATPVVILRGQKLTSASGEIDITVPDTPLHDIFRVSVEVA
jgi:hypothetical protein